MPPHGARTVSSSVRRRTIAAACVTLSLWMASAAQVAHAGDGRVVVIDVDPRVADALVVALSPWSLTVVRAPGPTPASDVDAAAARARVMASDLHAGAVVWIAPPRPPDDQATLWVYDAETLELAVRPLTVWAPFDDAGAAARRPLGQDRPSREPARRDGAVRARAVSPCGPTERGHEAHRARKPAGSGDCAGGASGSRPSSARVSLHGRGRRGRA